MIVSDFVPRVYLLAAGKQATFVTGSTKWLKILAIANIKIDEWADEPHTDWNSLYLPDYSLGSVGASQTFALPSTIRKLSQQEGNVLRIIHSDGSTFTDYSIIDFQRQKDYENGMRTFQNQYVTEVNRVLRFNRAFTSTDPQYGGTLYGPCFGYPGPGTTPNYLVNDSDVIPVDIPNWLVYATAAQYNSTDVTRQNLVPRLETIANNIMAQMKANNKGQVTKLYQPWRPLAENWVEGAWE